MPKNSPIPSDTITRLLHESVFSNLPNKNAQYRNVFGLVKGLLSWVTFTFKSPKSAESGIHATASYDSALPGASCSRNGKSAGYRQYEPCRVTAPAAMPLVPQTVRAPLTWADAGGWSSTRPISKLSIPWAAAAS